MSDQGSFDPSSQDHPLLELVQLVLGQEEFDVRNLLLDEAREAVLAAEDEYFVIAVLAGDSWADIRSRVSPVEISLANYTSRQGAAAKLWDLYLVCLVQERFADAADFDDAERFEADTTRVRKYIRDGVLPEESEVRQALAPFLPLRPPTSQATVDPLQSLEEKLRTRGINAEMARVAVESFVRSRTVRLPS